MDIELPMEWLIAFKTCSKKKVLLNVSCTYHICQSETNWILDRIILDTFSSTNPLSAFSVWIISFSGAGLCFSMCMYDTLHSWALILMEASRRCYNKIITVTRMMTSRRSICFCHCAFIFLTFLGCWTNWDFLILLKKSDIQFSL